MGKDFKIGELVSLVTEPSCIMEIVRINADGSYKCKRKISAREWVFEHYPGNEIMKYRKIRATS